MRAARATPPIISAFHAVRILSSRPGRTRLARAASSLPIALPSCAARLNGVEPGACADFVEIGRDDEMPRLALEVRRTIETVAQLDDRELVGIEQRANLVTLPHVITAFVPFRIGIERAEKTTVRRDHLARDPRRARVRRPLEAGLVEHGGGIRVHRQQLRVVVEHLLEVRNLPCASTQ